MEKGRGIISVVAGGESYEAEFAVRGTTGRVVTPIFGVTIEVVLLPGGNKVELRVLEPGLDPELTGRTATVPIFAVADAVQRSSSHPYGGLGHASLVDAAAVAAVAQMMAAS